LLRRRQWGERGRLMEAIEVAVEDDRVCRTQQLLNDRAEFHQARITLVMRCAVT